MAQTVQAVILLSRGGYSRAPQEQINKVVASLHAAREAKVKEYPLVEAWLCPP